MLYKKYRLYNEGIEVMIPSGLKRSTSRFAVQNSFVSDNGRIVVNIARGVSDLTQECLITRMDEYYRKFAKDVPSFDCLKIHKRQFLDDLFGEFRYRSGNMTNAHCRT